MTYYFWLGREAEDYHYVEGVPARLRAYMEKWSGDFG